MPEGPKEMIASALKRLCSPRAALGAALLATGILFIRAYLRDPSRRAERIFSRTWWAWADQGRYHRDALAWAAGNLDPSQHYYFPGYALIAAPFVHITPLNPFAIPDFVCTIATGWLLAMLGKRLAPDRPWMPALTAWTFFAVLAFRQDALRVWIDPWDTTPTVPLCLWVLLAALRFGERPTAFRALIAGASAGLVVAFRPTEALIYGAAGAIFCAARLPSLPPARAARAAAAAAAGALLGIVPGVLAYVATHGLRASPYIMLSRQIGFDIRLLPYQWVTIMLSPGPVLARAPALVPMYPWFVSGIAGILAGIAGARARTGPGAHLLVGAAALANLLVFLCYRDLHSVGLFRYGNQHYFKGVSAIFAMFTIVLADGLRRSRRARWISIAALACALATVPWRLQFRPDPAAVVVIRGDRIDLPQGIKSIDYTLLVRTRTQRVDYGAAGITMAVAGKALHPTSDFRPVPIPGGFALRILRPLPRGPAELDLPPDIHIDKSGGAPARAGWFTIRPI